MAITSSIGLELQQVFWIIRFFLYFFKAILTFVLVAWCHLCSYCIKDGGILSCQFWKTHSSHAIFIHGRWGITLELEVLNWRHFLYCIILISCVAWSVPFTDIWNLMWFVMSPSPFWTDLWLLPRKLGIKFSGKCVSLWWKQLWVIFPRGFSSFPCQDYLFFIIEGYRFVHLVQPHVKKICCCSVLSSINWGTVFLNQYFLAVQNN